MSLSFKPVSADSHVVEPPDLWTKRIDRKFLDRAPRLVHEADQDMFWCPGGRQEKRGIGTSSSVAKDAKDISMAERWENVLPGSYDPFERLKDQDRDGVEAEVLYTTFGTTFYPMTDLDFQLACMQAFNDWLANFCATAPKRLFGVAMIPTEPLDRAVKEMERCRKMGMVSAQISVQQEIGEGYNHAKWAPLWDASADLDMPVSLHVAGDKKWFTLTNNMLVDFSLAFTPVMYSICTMIMGGTFDRHPKLKVLSVENDASWPAPALERMDYHYFRDQGWAGKGSITSGRTPSQIFHDQVICTFMRDKTAVRMRDVVGTKNMMWGSDFPHYDGTWPKSIPNLEEHFPGVPIEDQKRIARTNVIDLYHLPIEP
jgi:predicted TIM-barrel fold metal-dependent hydrolase